MARKEAPRDCPCGSGARYRDCCGPFHRGEGEAPTSETLMRSRYAAFALGEVAYLLRTLHEENDARAGGDDAALRAIAQTCRAARFMGLTIVESAEDRVLFIARVFEKGRDCSFAELSSFVHDGIGWRYRNGLTKPLAEALRAVPLSIESFARG